MNVEGKVKWYSKNKKFGFISRPDNEETNIFFRVENIIGSEDPLDEGKDIIIPENGDTVIFEEYKYKEQKRAKKIKIKQRNSINFICPNCKEKIVPKIEMTQNSKRKEKKIGIDFEEEIPVRKVCPNCYHVIEEFKTVYDSLNKYNKYAGVVLILLITYIFHLFLN